MPPKGRTQVSDDERAILGWWIQAGAPEEKADREPECPAGRASGHGAGRARGRAEKTGG